MGQSLAQTQGQGKEPGVKYMFSAVLTCDYVDVRVEVLRQTNC